jgi:hypothetical protein
MPQMTYSAMRPSGSWQSDAMDQVEQLNANRGDEWSRYALSLMQQNQARQQQQAAEDWRKEVALRSLSNEQERFHAGREDSAAERAARYGYMDRELALRGQSVNAENEWNKIRIDEARRLAQERADEANALTQFDPSALGYDAKTAAAIRAMPRGLQSQVYTARLAQQIARQGRPEERADIGENARIEAAMNSLNAMQGRRDLSPREMNEFNRAKAVAQTSGLGDITGGVETSQEKLDSKFRKSIRELTDKAEELAGGWYGIATDDDVKVVNRMYEDLVLEMEKAGYSVEEIRSALSGINAKLSDISSDFQAMVR